MGKRKVLSHQAERYPPELRERATSLFEKVRPAYESDQAAFQAVAGILGIGSPDDLRNWINSGHDPGSRNRMAFIRRIFRRSLFRTYTVIISSVVVILGGLGLIYSQQLLGIGQANASAQVPHLEVDQVDLTDVPGKPIDIDIKLLNTGTQIVAINSARLVIQDAVTIPECVGQGVFESTGSYTANLPESPSPNQEINIPISQLVEPNGADRFHLLLAPRLPKTEANRITTYIYRIHIYLSYNVGTRPLSVGEVLGSFPVIPSGGDYFWSKYWASNPSLFRIMTRSNESAARACDIRNSHALQSILSQPGIRAADIAEIPPQLAY